MTAEELIYDYKREMKVGKVDPDEFKIWATVRLNKHMLKPLFTAIGKGGGQTYKTLYEVYDSRNNRNRQCYFYNENVPAIRMLRSDGHLTLQNWIDDANPDLKIKK